MTGRQLANQLGIRPSTLSKMEHGNQMIPAELLPDWCNALGISLGSALDMEEPRKGPVAEYMGMFNELRPEYRDLVIRHFKMVYKLDKQN